MKYCDSCRSSYPLDFTTCPKDSGSLRLVTDLLPGMLLRGKYEILEKVGAGGMGAVYKARHVAFDEIRAIKFVSGHLATDESFLARFRSEAVVARKLNHPNAVRVDDLDSSEDGRPFIVMEYVQGRSLRDALDEAGALPIPRAIDIARQACAALKAAHELGVVHRDIKPDNLLLLEQGDGSELVKILAFGLAKVRDGFDLGAENVSTHTGRVLGTPQYMSPEQAMGRKRDEIDGRADLYAVGVMLFEMVTGELPFQGETPMAMLMQHVQDQPRAPHEVRPDLGISRALSGVVLKALEKSPQRRFATAAEMNEALAALSTGTKAATVVVPRATSGTLPAQPATMPNAAGRAITRKPVTRPLAAPARPASRERMATLPISAEAPAGGTAGVWMWGLIAGAVLLAGVMFTRRGSEPTPPSPMQQPAGGLEPPAPQGAGSRPFVDLTDDQVRAEAERLLFLSPALRDARLSVEVTNGIVTLSGSVPSQTSADLAVSLAASVKGARKVFNTAVVPAAAAPPPPSDDVVESAPAPTLAPAAQLPTSAPAGPGPPQANGDQEQVRRLLEEARRQVAVGNHDAAAEIFLSVLKIDPNNPIARDALQHVRERPPGPRRP